MSRRRYRYDPERKEVVEIGADWDDAPRRAQTPTEELTYGKCVATDGTVLDTKRKHREYMQHHGLALASDYTETWKRAEKERAQAWTNREQKESRKAALIRAAQQGKRR
jgi:hypothetical protein